MSTTASGATPGDSATPSHRYPFGPEFAAYRLPFPGLAGLTPREAGIGFDGEPSDAGATPPAAGAPATPPATGTPTPPATGAPEPDTDGMTTDSGREALRREREARKAAEKERDELRLATATDAEKAIKAAVAEAVKAERESNHAVVRRYAVEGSLKAAGLTNDKDLELAINAPSFAGLSVEDGQVKGLPAAVDAFKKDHPALFAPAAPAVPGQPSRGPQGTGDKPAASLEDAVTAHYRN